MGYFFAFKFAVTDRQFDKDSEKGHVIPGFHIEFGTKEITVQSYFYVYFHQLTLNLEYVFISVSYWHTVGRG